MKPGKTFEADLRRAAKLLEGCYYYRLRDSPAAWANGTTSTEEKSPVRFGVRNPFDALIYWSGLLPARLLPKFGRLYALELKTVKGASLPNNAVRKNQIDGLLDAANHGVYAGLLVYFREPGEIWFLPIKEYLALVDETNKKSINIIDISNSGRGVLIPFRQKRTRIDIQLEALLN